MISFFVKVVFIPSELSILLLLSIFVSAFIGLVLVSKMVKNEMSSERRKSIYGEEPTDILFTDFWFDSYLTRRIATMLYVIAVYVWLSAMVYLVISIPFFAVPDLFNSETTRSLQDLIGEYIMGAFGLLIALVAVRLVIEFWVALVKIAENTSRSNLE